MTHLSRWEQMNSSRSQVLTRARDAARLTIPSLMPPEGHDQNTVLPTPYQSLGARGVNNLSSKLLLALAPPSTSFFRLTMEDTVREELGAQKTDAEEALRIIETRVVSRIEKVGLRPVLHQSLKHLVTTGNALLYLPKDRRNRMFPLDRYCVTRAADGRLIEIVIKESVAPQTLSEEVQAACECTADRMQDSSRKDVDIFTRVELKDGKHVWSQEINDKPVPDSEGEAPETSSPFLALRWTAVSGEDYGRGHVEEYMGDLISLEGLNKAIVSFSAAAARVLILLRPNAALDADDMQAESGSVVIGNPEDVSTFGLDKFYDFKVSKEVVDDLTLRLSHAFLLSSGTVRNAERVTAEEVRMQAQELEDVLGGVYTVQSQDLQLPLVRRYVSLMQAEGAIPPLPGVDPTIVTGFEALGRGHELNKLRAYFQDAMQMFGEEALQFFKTDVGLKMLATSHNVEVSELVKTIEEVAQENQEAQAAAFVQSAAGPMVGAMAQQATEE